MGRLKVAEPALAIRDLSVVLHREGRGVRILDRVSLEAVPGEIVALVGESGSGKSTLGLAVQGLLPAESRPVVTGSIRVAGVELVGAAARQLRAARRSLVRAVPQDPMAGLNPTMTIRRQLAGSTRDATAIRHWLARAGLADPDRIAAAYPHCLSGGQRQRVLIAMAMMARPKLIIADEPTTALDVTTQAHILEWLRELARQQQTAILFITHDLGVAASLADRMVVLEEGRVVETGPTRAILDRPTHAGTRALLASRFDLKSDRSRPVPVGSALKAWPVCAAVEAATALRLSGVHKSYASGARTPWGRRPQPVLSAIDLTIRRGECLALVGESGAGKSTILRIAAGLVAPDRGEVVRADLRPQMVFQDPASALTPWLTIGEQIGERLRGSGLAAAERDRKVEEALGLAGLDPALARALPAELSLGQCQRAAIARAIIVPPKLLLCDEPVCSMDVPLAATILNLLGALRRRLGMAMLFATHDLAAARLVADRIAVLRHGRLVEQGDPDALIAAPATEYTRALIAAVPKLENCQ
ncbi:ABC transporter ATP-binding protein [Kaistia sp. 32K]|uniref:ATP-binding cassette domain-containing protein n=1 Tax=Kaistia sp. 32K TaxID=2795690 RepID=UPI00193809FA|nr:ABC transporter ATP-binding protein [Kaistia sp. 32K]BCP55574.1 ABC transporter ATP-binding protein [Kaistia sp. 32K]